jgi:hypothetical protein
MKFKLNDPVRVIATPSKLFDAVGTVVNVDRDAWCPFQVMTTDGPLWFSGHELVLAEAPKSEVAG